MNEPRVSSASPRCQGTTTAGTDRKSGPTFVKKAPEVEMRAGDDTEEV